MNKQELMAELNVSERTIDKELPRLKKQLLKQGKELVKIGRGSSAEYYIKNKETLYSLDKLVCIDNNIIELQDFAMLVALVFTIEPNTLIHKSYKEFLTFLELEPNAKNLKTLKDTLSYLDSIGLITYKTDTSDKDWFVGIWSIKSKMQYKIELKILKSLKTLIHQEKKSNKYIVLLLKTLVGIKIINSTTITQKQFCARFNLSVYQFNECMNILIKHNIINKELIQVKYEEIKIPQTIGTKYYLNGLEEIARLIET